MKHFLKVMEIYVKVLEKKYEESVIKDSCLRDYLQGQLVANKSVVLMLKGILEEGIEK